MFLRKKPAASDVYTDSRLICKHTREIRICVVSL